MNKLTISAAAASAAGAIVLAGVAVTAHATSAPPADRYRVGTLSLQSAGGGVVASGSLGAPLAAKAVGDSHLPAGTKAVLYVYTYSGPVSTSKAVATFAPGGVWTGSQVTAATAYSGTPTATIDASSLTLAQFKTAHVLPGNGLVELRLRTVSGGTVSDNYEALDLYVSGDRWTTVGKPWVGTGSTGSTAHLATAKVTEKIARSVKHTAKPTVKVTVKAGSTKPAGKVTVFDGTKKLATTSLKKGKATLRLKKLKKGQHHIRTVYSGSSTVAAATSKTITVTSK